MAKAKGSGDKETGREYSERITESDVAAFADKLDEWGMELPPKDRALLQLILTRAQGMEIDVGGEAGSTLPGVLATTISVLQPLVQRLRAARIRGWVEAGEPWIQQG
jgi:hypothetical protein